MMGTSGRRFQFSLRAMLVVLTLTSLAFAALVRSAKRQKVAVTAIRQSGGTVMYDYHETAPRTMSTAGGRTAPKWLRELVGDEYFQRPVWIQFFGSAKDDRWVQAMADLPSTKYLLLAENDVDDQILERIAPLPKLEELHLSNSKVTDLGFRELRKFRRLRWLVADRTLITDEALAELTSLPLEELNLRETRVTDAGILSLAKLTRLKKLDVRRTAVTAAGVARLRAALPNCWIMR